MQLNVRISAKVVLIFFSLAWFASHEYGMDGRPKVMVKHPTRSCIFPGQEGGIFAVEIIWRFSDGPNDDCLLMPRWRLMSLIKLFWRRAWPNPFFSSLEGSSSPSSHFLSLSIFCQRFVAPWLLAFFGPTLSWERRQRFVKSEFRPSFDFCAV